MGYGSGDIAGNVIYGFLSSFVMIFLTITVGLSSGIVGTLIAVSKRFDRVTGIFFSAIIGKTHTKMGKARPGMLWGYVGCTVNLAAILHPSGYERFCQMRLVLNRLPPAHRRQAAGRNRWSSRRVSPSPTSGRSAG